MLPSGSATDPEAARNLTLDRESFQKLLMAAYVLQCERDRVRADPEVLETDFSGQLPASRFVRMVDNPLEQAQMAMDCVGLAQVASADVSGKVPPARVQQIYSAEISGALALAPLPSAKQYSGPVPLQKAPSKKAPRSDSSPGPVLALVPAGVREPDTRISAMQFVRSLPAMAHVGGILVLLSLLVLVTFELNHHRQLLPSAEGHPLRLANGSSGATGNSTSNAPLLESSHRRVTDASASSQLENLSRFEMRVIRREAEFGDDNAALVVAMAYEVGQGLPQSCAQAAHWVEIAARDGNAAAQYNLGLRYLSGDGVSVDANEGRRWMQASADLGYENARVALRHMRF